MIDFTIGGGSGNADLYVSSGTLPTDDDYQCLSSSDTNVDTCDWFHPAAATFYVRVHGTTAFSGLSLQASAVPFFLQPSKGHPWTVSGAAGSVTFAFFRFPPGVKRMTIQVSGGKGDVDLYVRRFSLPTPFANDSASAHPGRHTEKCDFKPPTTLTYYIGVYGRTAFSNLKLKGTYSK